MVKTLSSRRRSFPLFWWKPIFSPFVYHRRLLPSPSTPSLISSHLTLTSMEDFTGQCVRLLLHTEECQTIPLTSVIEHNSRVLVAKLFTKRRVNVESLARTLKSMWRFAQDFEVRDLTQNTVLQLFTLESDVQKILSQGPWTFAKCFFFKTNYKTQTISLVSKHFKLILFITIQVQLTQFR